MNATSFSPRPWGGEGLGVRGLFFSPRPWGGEGLGVRGLTAPFRIAEDAVKHDVDKVLGLFGGGLARAGEVVGEHGAVEQIAHHVADALDWHVADAALADHDPIAVLPALGVGGPVFKVSGLFAILELGPLLDEQL